MFGASSIACSVFCRFFEATLKFKVREHDDHAKQSSLRKCHADLLCLVPYLTQPLMTQLHVEIVAGGIVDCERLAILPVQVRTTRAQGAPFMRHLPEPYEGLTATA